MSIWQVQIHKTNLTNFWNGASSWYVPVKIDKIFKDMPNVFDIADDIIVWYDADGRNHNRTLRHVMQICHQEHFKLNKIISFQMHEDNILCGDIWRSATGPKDAVCANGNAPPSKKKELQSLLGTVNYLGTILPSTTQLCESLWKLTL